VNEYPLKSFLDEQVIIFNHRSFIAHDPICIPHQFSKLQDIEIMGFMASTLAWGQRTTIIKNCNKLIELMDGEPYHFIINPDQAALKAMVSFAHRTFNGVDLLYFISFFNQYYKEHNSLESAFSRHLSDHDLHVGPSISGFHKTFFSLKNAPARTQKHVATPDRKSACKRLNMFLRWMVRKDNNGVDFGLWTSISMSQLICPLDVHVSKVAYQLGLINTSRSDWRTALELTAILRQFDPIDPAKYDFALFGLGAFSKKPMEAN